MKRDELMARAKPVLFNTEMVTAIMEGRKTQTRRAIKPPRKYVGGCDYIDGIGRKVKAAQLPNGGCVVAPYQVGDILYVRETWTRFSCDNCKADAIGMCLHKMQQTEQDSVKGCCEYKAGYPEGDCVVWHPSIHMPKAAARLFLRVTDVRAERLHEITARDVLAEGVERKEISPSGCRCAWQTEGCKDKPCGNRDAYERACHVPPFAALWDSTVKKADRAVYGWDANPWVWVYEFERVVPT